MGHTTDEDMFLMYTAAINIGPHQKDAIEDYKKHKAEGRFLELEFESVTEYLQLLQIGGTTLGQFEGKVFYLLAAAVSDFYVPVSKTLCM